MNEQIENPPAFPSNYKVWLGAGEFTDGQHEGMTLRDFFAEGVDIPWNACIASMEKQGIKDPSLWDVAKSRAVYKYLEADAMLAERTKGQPK